VIDGATSARFSNSEPEKLTHFSKIFSQSPFFQVPFTQLFAPVDKRQGALTVGRITMEERRNYQRMRRR
jgi:hypothetical protein